MTSFKLDYLPKTPPSNNIICRGLASMYEFSEYKSVQSATLYFKAVTLEGHKYQLLLGSNLNKKTIVDCL